MEKKVLVVNCGRNGLGLIRSLGEKNIFIIAVDHKNTPAIHSKFVNKKYILPDRLKNEDQFIEGLIQISKKHSEKIYLIPTNDEYLEIFVKNKHLLVPYYHFVFQSDKNKLENCVDKVKVHSLLINKGIQLPHHYILKNLDFTHIHFPVIIKPANKQSTSVIGKAGMFRIKTCSNKSELTNAILRLTNINCKYVIQEIIPGHDDQLYTCGVVAKEGKLKACFTGRKLRQFPPKTGEASYAESIENNELVLLAKKIVSITSFTGIAQIEFKHYSGKFYFIEMNPRSWSWNSLSTYCGVNLPYIAINDTEHLNEQIVTNKRYGRWIFAYEDFLHNVLANKNISLAKFLKQLSDSENHAYFSKYDITPFIRFYFFDLKNLFKHLIKTTLNNR